MYKVTYRNVELGQATTIVETMVIASRWENAEIAPKIDMHRIDNCLIHNEYVVRDGKEITDVDAYINNELIERYESVELAIRDLLEHAWEEETNHSITLKKSGITIGVMVFELCGNCDGYVTAHIDGKEPVTYHVTYLLDDDNRYDSTVIKKCKPVKAYIDDKCVGNFRDMETGFRHMRNKPETILSDGEQSIPLSHLIFMGE